MSRELAKMNLISVVQQLPKEDIETIQGYVEMIEKENQELKKMVELYSKSLYNAELTKYKEVIDKALEYLEVKRIREKAIVDIDVLEGILKEVE